LDQFPFGLMAFVSLFQAYQMSFVIISLAHDDFVTEKWLLPAYLMPIGYYLIVILLLKFVLFLLLLLILDFIKPSILLVCFHQQVF
jgi:hypothetical protein